MAAEALHNPAEKNLLSVKAKEAIKTSLAVVLVYAIVLQMSWFDPYWAALAVLMVSLPTAGQTIHKSINRLAGTVPGCIAALVIMSLAPQSRWEFMFLAAAWVFFTTYMLLRSKNNFYMWKIAGFVCLIIVQAGPGSSESIFIHAVFRTMDTVVGIVVYTLISLFLWPQTNTGAIKKVSYGLLTTLAESFREGSRLIGSKESTTHLSELHTKGAMQLTQLDQALLAEGSENYERQEFLHTWEQFQDLSAAMVESLNRWHSGFVELVNIDINTVFPEMKSFCKELDSRFDAIQQTLDGSATNFVPQRISLNLNYHYLDKLSHFDHLALLNARKELENLEMLTAVMFDCVQAFSDDDHNSRQVVTIPTLNKTFRATRLPVFSRDHLQGALFAAVNMIAGFLIWIVFDPPGGGGYFVIMTIFAMTIAVKPQINIIILVKSVAVSLFFGIVIYLFIMPRLSTFTELGLVLFIALFTIRYSFSGLAQFVGSYGVIKMISIQNAQTYNFISLADTYIMFVSSLIYLFILTYMMRSTRPEKALLSLQRRFFRSAEFLLLQMVTEHKNKPLLIERWQTDYHLNELKMLPDNISRWGKYINTDHFPDNKQQQVQALVISLQSLVYRIDQLLESHYYHAESPEMKQEIQLWLKGIAAIFSAWALNPQVESSAELQQRLSALMIHLEQFITETLKQTDKPEESQRQAYLLLGRCRGISEAAILYAAASEAINWAQWREEVFS